MEVIQFRKMLAEVSKGVRDEELKAMKFICKDYIPKRRQEEIKSALQLWEALEEREMLGVYNTRFLRELLQTSGEGRTDLLRIVQCYDGQPVSGPTIPTATIHPVQETNQIGHTGLEKEIYYVADNIGRDWRMLGRTLGVREPDIERISDMHSRDLREQGRQCLFMWRNNHPETANREKLLAALRDISQNFIADELEEMP